MSDPVFSNFASKSLQLPPLKHGVTASKRCPRKRETTVFLQQTHGTCPPLPAHTVYIQEQYIKQKLFFHYVPITFQDPSTLCILNFTSPANKVWEPNFMDILDLYNIYEILGYLTPSDFRTGTKMLIMTNCLVSRVHSSRSYFESLYKQCYNHIAGIRNLLKVQHLKPDSRPCPGKHVLNSPNYLEGPVRIYIWWKPADLWLMYILYVYARQNSNLN